MLLYRTAAALFFTAQQAASRALNAIDSPQEDEEAQLISESVGRSSGRSSKRKRSNRALPAARSEWEAREDEDGEGNKAPPRTQG
ncbi:hypothetical protein U1Q18_044721 [Sarracenia purpurea var. burkii]